MSVIEPACSVACDTPSACGCKEQQRVEKRGPRVAAATAVAAAACTACCVLPLALPPVILGTAGGLMATLDHAHGWVTRIAVVIVIVAWAWIGWQLIRRKRRITAYAMALMILATVLTGVATAWPLLEPFAFSALGAAKGAHRNG
jgi:hypothetical protein